MKISKKGFTLAEVLVAIVIGLISVAAAFSAYNYYTKSYEAVSQKAKVNTAARDALLLITKDLRNAGYIGTTFIANNCENHNELKVRSQLLSVSSKRYGRYSQGDLLTLWFAISPQDRKQVTYTMHRKQNSPEYYLARDVRINPDGQNRGGCPGYNANYNHPIVNEELVPNLVDFQVILKDKDGKILVPVCTSSRKSSCGPEEIKRGVNNSTATSYGNMTLGQANAPYVHTADVYITVRSAKEVYKSNRSYKIVTGEANHGGNINVSSDKYYRETFFASVHTRNLAIPQVPVTNTSGSVGEGQGYNR